MQIVRDNPGNPPHRFKPGEQVRESGLYEVVHGSVHRRSQRGVLLRGRVFPTCKECGDQVRYQLVEPAMYIFEDEDFAPQR